MDITDLSLVELKAMAYDIIGQIEQRQKNLAIVNGRIKEVQNGRGQTDMGTGAKGAEVEGEGENTGDEKPDTTERNKGNNV